MLQMHSTVSSYSPKYHPLQQAGRLKTLQSPVTQVHGVLNRSQGKKYAIKCSQSSFSFTNKITNREDTSNRNYKSLNNYHVPATLQDSYASNSEDDAKSKSFQSVFFKKLDALYRFIRPYAGIGIIIATTSNSLLAVEKFADLTPTFFIELFKAFVPAILLHIYGVAINQVADVEIDKVNKPYLPLASGEFSMGAGLALTYGSALMSLVTALMLRSPPLVLGAIAWLFVGTAYSAHGPFLRWKANSFGAAISMVFMCGILTQFPIFIHMQKYVLGRPAVITKPLMFASAFVCCLSVAIAFLKDLHDMEGDLKHGVKTLSVMLGKEKVFRFCVSMLSIAYGGAVVVGASSPFQISKLVTVIGHCILASILWYRARNIDLSSDESTFSFYMFIWQLYYAECFLIPFVR